MRPRWPIMHADGLGAAAGLRSLAAACMVCHPCAVPNSLVRCFDHALSCVRGKGNTGDVSDGRCKIAGKSPARFRRPQIGPTCCRPPAIVASPQCLDALNSPYRIALAPRGFSARFAGCRSSGYRLIARRIDDRVKLYARRSFKRAGLLPAHRREALREPSVRSIEVSK